MGAMQRERVDGSDGWRDGVGWPGPIRVVPLGTRVDDGVIIGSYVLPDGTAGRPRHWILDDARCRELWDDARPTEELRALPEASRAGLRWMDERGLVSVVGPGAGPSALDFGMVFDRPVKPIEHLDDGLRFSTADDSTFVLSEPGVRLLQELAERITVADAIRAVVRRTLADPHDAAAVDDWTAATGTTFEALMVDEMLQFAETLLAVSAAHFERVP